MQISGGSGSDPDVLYQLTRYPQTLTQLWFELHQQFLLTKSHLVSPEGVERSIYNIVVEVNPKWTSRSIISDIVVCMVVMMLKLNLLLKISEVVRDKQVPGLEGVLIINGN